MTRPKLAAAVAAIAAAPNIAPSVSIASAFMLGVSLCDDLQPLVLGTLMKFRDGSYFYVGHRTAAPDAEEFAVAFVGGEGYADGEWPDTLQVVACLEPLRRNMEGIVGFATISRRPKTESRHPAAAAGDQFQDIIGDVRRELRRDVCHEPDCPHCNSVGADYAGGDPYFQAR